MGVHRTCAANPIMASPFEGSYEDPVSIAPYRPLGRTSFHINIPLIGIPVNSKPSVPYYGTLGSQYSTLVEGLAPT